jgi:hypothetical protein
MTGAVDFARRWVDYYTGWVAAEASERRRAEIESDLWEQRADACARNLPPSAVRLSIARRVIAGIPADLLWVHTQRLAARGRPAERKARLMTAFRRFAATWWWTLAAATLAGLYIWTGAGNLATPGMPYLDGTIQAFTLAALILAGVALQRTTPRVAAALAVAGALSGVTIVWSPVIQILAVTVCTGATILAMRQTSGTAARTLTAAGLFVVGLAPVVFVLLGQLPITRLHGLALVAALAGTALLIASGRPRKASAA